MRNLLLSAALIALPVGLFAAGYSVLVPPAVAQNTVARAAAPSLGDMSAFATIITDVQGIAATSDFTAAEKRITDFETAWDDAAGTLRPVNTTEWGTVDTAADGALSALRAAKPDAAQVSTTLATLQAALANPALLPDGTAPVAGSPVAVVTVSGVATTDANGRALPCEVMLKDLTARVAGATLPTDTAAKVADLTTKALERCNADDDARADGFTAQALALIPAL